MSLWVKICANTSLEDAQLAADAGADAVGFVFAPSPRRVTKEQVASIVSGLPAGVEKIGVFVDASLGEIETTVRATGLTGVQLHSDVAASETKALRETFGPGLRIIRVVHFGADPSGETTLIEGDPNVDAVLVDSRTTTAVGGTGVRFDWAAASGLFRNAQVHTRLIAAGGLNPENVAEAIETMKPWGVDVASGVEASPGRKDPAKVKAFVARARQMLLG